MSYDSVPEHWRVCPRCNLRVLMACAVLALKLMTLLWAVIALSLELYERALRSK